jgi:hypothetical protein
VDEISEWFGYLEGFRHALAHRIPLYVYPFVVTSDEVVPFREFEMRKEAAAQQDDFAKYDQLDAAQAELGKPRPIMAHSLRDKNSPPIHFHSQILCDWNTVVEIVDRVFRQPNW